MKRVIIATLSILCAGSVLAAKDASTMPNDFYLFENQSPNSLKILPPPPSFDSIDYLRDKMLYDNGKALRSTERGQQAYSDGDASKNSISKTFSNVMGFTISVKNSPEIYKLITTMKEDAGDLATRSAKQFYNRVRPFSFYNEETCRPEDQKTLSTNGSYPSGHTAIGWSIALVLAEIHPEQQDAILKRGYELGQSRVICGYHWQSDIDAARVMASAVVARDSMQIPRLQNSYRKQKKKSKKFSL